MAGIAIRLKSIRGALPFSPGQNGGCLRLGKRRTKSSRQAKPIGGMLRLAGPIEGSMGAWVFRLGLLQHRMVEDGSKGCVSGSNGFLEAALLMASGLPVKREDSYMVHLGRLAHHGNWF